MIEEELQRPEHSTNPSPIVSRDAWYSLLETREFNFETCWSYGVFSYNVATVERGNILSFFQDFFHWTIWEKSLLNSLQYSFCFMFVFVVFVFCFCFFGLFGCEARGILVSRPGIEPSPLCIGRGSLKGIPLRNLKKNQTLMETPFKSKSLGNIILINLLL